MVQPTEREATPAGAVPGVWKRGFWSLFVTQFQGAFNDNAFKFLVMFMVMARYSQEEKDQLVPVIGAVFALPFILFSMSAGYLSDRHSKRGVAIGTKVAEVGIMLLAMLGLALGSSPLLIASVFLLSTQSAFFGPAKYGLLPEMLPEKRLSWGNGILSLGTFLAIITGQVAGGLLSDWFGDNAGWSGLILLACSGVGLMASLGIAKVPAADVTRKFRFNFVPEFLKHWRLIRQDRPLFMAVVGDAYFWFLAAILQVSVLFYGKEVLLLSDTEVSLLMAAMAVGIGTGSCAAGFLSGQKIEYGLVPLGAIGLTIFSGLLAFPGLGFGGALLVLMGLGFFGGFYVVPLAAMVQHRPAREHKGSVIATLALLSFVGVFLASCVYYLFRLGLGLSLPQVFLACSLMTLVGTVYVVWLLPDSLLRLGLWMLTHTLYRVHLQGRDRIPEEGGGLLVANHLSLVDALFIIASTDRQVRFIMLKEMYEKKWIKPIAKVMQVIPISPQQQPREMLRSMEVASEAIRNGHLVCIFAEGQVSRTGQMQPFRRGLERIMQGVNAPIIPVCLDRVWGSIFSYVGGRFIWKWPQRIPFPVTVSYGPHLPPTATAVEVRQAVQELATQAWPMRKKRMRTLHRAFIRTSRLYPRRFAMADARVPRVSHFSALARTIFLAQRLREPWKGQEMVGLLLPPSVPGALINLAALLSGKVPVNINYTLSKEAMRSCLEQCGMQKVLTSRVFLKQMDMVLPCRTEFIEEYVQSPTLLEKLGAGLLATVMPSAWLEAWMSQGRTRDLNDVATVIFSSGSTGQPKGVMLSHYNIASNIEQLGQAFALSPEDRMLGVLPFFHSFGFTCTLGAPAVLGPGVVYHANPLDARQIGLLARQHAVTHLMATPTFLQLYFRACDRDQFAKLKMVMVGAEKLSPRLADAFEGKFDVRPMEAYGCTECAPAVTANTPGFHGPGVRQVGDKVGSIGHPLPGISVRIVDPETRAPLPLGQAGLLLVSGPNVMMGYLGQPDTTREVLQDGWYVTGDIATLDEDGFLTITDRLSRFSKIGGEMVPHIKVEEHLHELAGLHTQSFVVTSVPDDRKGERLAVIHNVNDAVLALVLDKLPTSDLPNLWKPRRDQFKRVEALPLLGTGKLDLRRIRELALEGAPSPAPSPAAPTAPASSSPAPAEAARTDHGAEKAPAPSSDTHQLRLSRKEKRRMRKKRQ